VCTHTCIRILLLCKCNAEPFVHSKSSKHCARGRSKQWNGRVRDDSRAMRPGTSWRPGYKIEPYPTISRENFIYFILDVPGNRRKPGASQKNVGFKRSYVFLTCSGFPTVSRDVSYKVQGRVATKGHLSHADYCNFVDFNFSA